MKFCVFAAGAVGGFVSGMVARSGVDVSMVTRGPHLDAIRANGLKLMVGDEAFTVSPQATDDPATLGVQDIVFLTAKSHTLPAAADAMGPLIGPDTIVVSAQNGIPFWYFHGHGGAHDGHTLQSVDPGGRIAEIIDCSRVIGCVITSSNEVAEPGVVRNIGNRVFALGEPDGSISSRVKEISAILEAAGLSAPVHDNIRDEVWVKMWGNVSFSSMAALTTARLGALVERDDLKTLGIRIMEECQAVGEALGITFQQTIDDRVAGTHKVGMHKPSILQDLLRGRAMEIDGTAGAVVELSRLVKIDTPMVDLIYALQRQRAREAGLYTETGFDPLAG